MFNSQKPVEQRNYIARPRYYNSRTENAVKQGTLLGTAGAAVGAQRMMKGTKEWNRILAKDPKVLHEGGKAVSKLPKGTRLAVVGAGTVIGGGIGAAAGIPIGAALTHKNSPNAKNMRWRHEARLERKQYKRMQEDRIKKDLTKDQIKHRKRIQAGLAMTTSTIGLAALASRSAGSAAPRLINRYSKLPAAERAAQGARVRQRLNDLSTGALTVGAGIGGVGGYNFASIQRAEGKQRKKAEATKYKIKAAINGAAKGGQTGSTYDARAPKGM